MAGKKCLPSLADYLLSDNLEIDALAPFLPAPLLYLVLQRGNVGRRRFISSHWQVTAWVLPCATLLCKSQRYRQSKVSAWSRLCGMCLARFHHSTKRSGNSFEITWFDYNCPRSEEVKPRQRLGSLNLPLYSLVAKWVLRSGLVTSRSFSGTSWSFSAIASTALAHPSLPAPWLVSLSPPAH